MLKLSIAFLFCISCGGQVDAQDSGTHTDGATSDAPILTNNDAGAPCNTISASGTDVTIMQVAADPPPFASQDNAPAIASGLYDLVSMTIYTGPNGSSQSGNTIDTVARFSAANNGFLVDSYSVTGDEQVVRESSNATINADGTLSLTQFCPTATPTVTIDYAFDGTTLTLRVLESSTETIDEVFTLAS